LRIGRVGPGDGALGQISGSGRGDNPMQIVETKYGYEQTT